MRARPAIALAAALLCALPAAARDLRGICGDWRLQGEVLEPIEAPGYCGIPLPVKVTEAYGVALSPPAVVNCRTARALADWLERGPVQDAPRLLSAHLDGLTLGGSYACRTRNFKGGRLSEHAAGNAVDVAGFRLSDGRRIGFGAWRKGGAGEFLLRAWRAACGPFGTVLGPDHDAIHADHFHFDTASRTDGPACW